LRRRSNTPAELASVHTTTSVVSASSSLMPSRTTSWSSTSRLVAVAAAAGGFLGDVGSYLLGRTAGVAAARRLFRGDKAKRRLDRAGQALDRHGAAIIVVARFVPGGRTATTFTAGTVHLPWPRFAVADAAGAILWSVCAAGLGYLGGETFERRPLYALGFGLGVALLIALSVEAMRRLRVGIVANRRPSSHLPPDVVTPVGRNRPRPASRPTAR
jgi:membrane protein DedA with SNARE-associated domain